MPIALVLFVVVAVVVWWNLNRRDERPTQSASRDTVDDWRKVVDFGHSRDPGVLYDYLSEFVLLDSATPLKVPEADREEYWNKACEVFQEMNTMNSMAMLANAAGNLMEPSEPFKERWYPAAIRADVEGRLNSVMLSAGGESVIRQGKSYAAAAGVPADDGVDVIERDDNITKWMEALAGTGREESRRVFTEFIGQAIRADLNYLGEATDATDFELRIHEVARRIRTRY